MITNCVCYVIDDNYLFPTLVSATQARANTDADTTAVTIVCVASPSDNTRLGEVLCKKLGLEFIVVPPSAIDNLHPTYGRLYIDAILNPAYSRLLYIDGDTQVVGSLRPLLTVPIESGKILAVRDPTGMFGRLSSSWERRIVAEREGSGISLPFDDYFNAGIFVCNREECAELSRKSIELMRSWKTPLKYRDQDTVNIAFENRIIAISNKWNFPGFLIGSPMERDVQPVIVHFMSNPRPWVFNGSPWGAKWQKPYHDFLKQNPEAAPLAPSMSALNKLKYHLRQNLFYFTEYRAVGRSRETAPQLVV